MIKEITDYINIWALCVTASSLKHEKALRLLEIFIHVLKLLYFAVLAPCVNMSFLYHLQKDVIYIYGGGFLMGSHRHSRQKSHHFSLPAVGPDPFV